MSYKIVSAYLETGNSIIPSKLGILDTKDGKVEYYTKNEIIDIIANKGIKIDGCFVEDGFLNYEILYNADKSEISKHLFMGDLVLTQNDTLLSFQEKLKSYRGGKIYNYSNTPKIDTLFRNLHMESLDLSEFDMSMIITMLYAFKDSEIRHLILPKDKMYNINYMAGTFEGLKSKSIDLSGADLGNLRNMNDLFYGCNINQVILNGANIKNVRNMYGMFHKANISFLDLGNLDTSNLVNTENMFAEFETSVLDLSSFTTENLQNSVFMFGWCNIGLLDIRQFKLNRSCNIASMFSGCSIEVIVVNSEMKESGILEGFNIKEIKVV